MPSDPFKNVAKDQHQVGGSVEYGVMKSIQRVWNEESRVGICTKDLRSDFWILDTAFNKID